MTLDDLIELYRAQSMDNRTGPFCSNALLTTYANEAQDEACRRGQLLVESSAPWCIVAVAADTESIDIDPCALNVTRAFVNGRPLIALRADEMDGISPGWQFHETRNTPSYLVTGLTTGKAHLWPRPAEACTIRLTAQRLPMKPMAEGQDTPEIRRELHPALVDWMLYRAYSRMDTDMYNDAKAALALRRFEQEFGGKAGGRNEEWVRSGAGMRPDPIA